MPPVCLAGWSTTNDALFPQPTLKHLIQVRVPNLNKHGKKARLGRNAYREGNAGVGRHASGARWTESDVARGGPGGDADELCAMVDGSCQCTIVLPENCLGYGLVVPFLAYRFALWLRIMKT